MFNAFSQIVSSMRLFFMILCLLTLFSDVHCHDDDTCIPVRRFANEIRTEVQQGQPGKRGAKGEEGQQGLTGRKGSKGQKGEVCRSVDNSEELQELKHVVRYLRDTVSDLMVSVRRTNVIHGIPFNSTDCTVGMKDGRVKDRDITASSWNPTYEARYGRLDIKPVPGVHNGYWACSTPPRTGQWIQVDLRAPTYVTGVVTQGRPQGNEWVTSFTLSYGNSTSHLRTIQNSREEDHVFQGSDLKINLFPQPIVARYFRLNPLTWRVWVVVRMEYLTC